MEQLSAWDNFYVIVGTAAATLTGLVFVVVTLVGSSRRLQRAGDALNTFNSPSVVHFSATLGTAALLTAPWRMFWLPDVSLGVIGVAGLGYMQVVLRRARRQTHYTPVLEDWLWHIIFPTVDYSALIVAALVGLMSTSTALFVAGAASVLFLFIGIHNAWDSVTYPVVTGLLYEDADQQEHERSVPD